MTILPTQSLMLTGIDPLQSLRSWPVNTILHTPWRDAEEAHRASGMDRGMNLPNVVKSTAQG